MFMTPRGYRLPFWIVGLHILRLFALGLQDVDDKLWLEQVNLLQRNLHNLAFAFVEDW